MNLSHADMAVILGHLKQAGLELEPCYKALAALAQQETDVTKIAGWCALCEEPNGCPHGHSEEEWIAANHRMIEQRRAALAPQDEHRGMQSRSCSIHGELLTCPICDANQAQPPCQHRRRTTFLDGSKVVDCECGAPWPCLAQQAQPEPTRAQLIDLFYHSGLVSSDSWVAKKLADAVLALFAPKEAT